MSSTHTAPPTMATKRCYAPQFLEPGQHIKVASRKPASKLWGAAGGDPLAGRPPRDPWEDLDDSAEEPCSTLAGEPGSQRPHRHHTCTSGGHPYSDRLSASRSNAASTSPHSKEGRSSDLAPSTEATPPMDDLNAAGDEDVDCGATINNDREKNYYSATSVLPELSAAERAKRVRDAQQRALEAKRLNALAHQRVAPRPKTLVRNRHGRLNAIAIHPASGTEKEAGPTMLISDTPASPSGQPKMMQGCSSTPPEAQPDPPRSHDDEGGSDSGVKSPQDSHNVLTESCSSALLEVPPGQLEIDLD
ncbi:hypothetical protein NXY56_000380 [Leishmania guyanensis]|uniref:Uncharacterized protein n=1 Tax=Leishmania guyanensis TaxID=5670 RepID=A0A1E1INQ3_LEIGU|nr:hypothetical protein BN36_0403140 [Leishmania guyanensis]